MLSSRPLQRWRFALVVVAVLALIAAGCSSSGEDTTTTGGAGESTTTAGLGESTTTTEEPSIEPVTISVLTFNSPEQFQPLIDAYAAERPNVTIDVQSVPFGDLNPLVESRVGSGDTSVDVYLVDQPRLASFASRGMLYDLTDDVEIPDGTLLDAAVEWSMFDGRLYGLPVHTSTQLLFYNKDLLAAAGFDAPSTNPDGRMTWEEVVEQAEAVGGEWGLLFEQGATPYQVLPLIESLGGGNGLTGDDSLTPALTTDGWLAAMTWWSDVHESGVIPRGMGFGVTAETFMAGNTPFFFAGPWQMWMVGNPDLSFEVGVAPHPYFEGGEEVTPTGSFTWGVNPASENIDAAVEFVKFVSLNPVGNSAITAGDPNIPANIVSLEEYLSQESFQIGVDGTVGELIDYEARNTAVLRPTSVGYIQYETILGAALEDIRNGLDIESTLANAEAEMSAAFSGLR